MFDENQCRVVLVEVDAFEEVSGVYLGGDWNYGNVGDGEPL